MILLHLFLPLLFDVLKYIFYIFSFPLLKPAPQLNPFSSVPHVLHFFSPSFVFPCFPSFLTQVVSQRFPQNSIGAVGSAMFLRFVNPAIVSPYEAGILDKKPHPRIERGLKLMSKVSLVYMLALWYQWLVRILVRFER